MKVKIIANTEFQGNVKKFNKLFNDGNVKFFLYSKKNEMILSSKLVSDYSVIDVNVEQGRRFIIEVEMVADTNDISDVGYICVVTKRNVLRVVENKIKSFDCLDY